MAVLEAHELYRFYHTGDEEIMALRGVSLRLERGEIVAVTGPSGSGKSTLLACLAGLDEPDGGYVTVLEERLTRRPEATRAALRARHFGIVLQSGNLFQHLSVEDNVLLQQELAAKTDRAYVRDLLATVGIQERRHAFPAQLSGGEAARAGLAVALAARPAVLLADEPTAEVDAETEAHLLRLFELRRAECYATLIVTHSSALAAHADRRLRISDGRVSSEA